MSMKAVEVPEAGADFDVVERPIPEPSPDEVRLDVEACGICHSDVFVKEGWMPNIEYPRIPGHEVIGRIDAVGEEVSSFEKGDLVGVGWHGGHCFECSPCRDGDFIQCENEEICGVTYDGGYAEYMTAPSEAVARMPGSIDPLETAPLLCAGITVYNALRNTDAKPGALVAIQGIGGLGHLAIQYANRAGFETAAISRTPEKEELARELGADHFIDAEQRNSAEALNQLGGARVLIATAPNSDAITSVVDGLGRNGELVVVGATDDPIEVTPFQLIMGRRSISGWPSGTAKDSEETVSFSEQEGIKPMIESFSLDHAGSAYEKMMNNEARFRCVLDI